jgi:hypothetical protein
MTIRWRKGVRPTGDAEGRREPCAICGTTDAILRYFLGAVDGGPMTALAACPEHMYDKRITRPNRADLKALDARFGISRDENGERLG